MKRRRGKLKKMKDRHASAAPSKQRKAETRNARIWAKRHVAGE